MVEDRIGMLVHFPNLHVLFLKKDVKLCNCFWAQKKYGPDMKHINESSRKTFSITLYKMWDRRSQCCLHTYQDTLRKGPSTSTSYLIFEVTVVLQDRSLVCACSDIILHHILLLGQVSIELEKNRRAPIKGNTISPQRKECTHARCSILGNSH